MTPRLEVLWHREIGDRLLVALEEEPRVECPRCEPGPSGDHMRYHKGMARWLDCCEYTNGCSRGSIPMPSGTRVELVQKARSCALCGGCEAHPDDAHPACWDSSDGKHVWNRHVPGMGPCVIPLGVATLEEVVPWGQPESYDAYACFAHVFRPTKDSGPVLRIIYRPPSDGPNPRRHTIYEPLRVDDLSPLSPKYVALCEVKK